MTQEAALSDAALLARFRNARNRPPCSVALGLEVLALSQSPAWARLAFNAPGDWCNPMGAIQGGFVTAMLDEAMAVAGIVAGGLGYVVPTLELKTSFLRPCPPGRLEADGRVLRWGAAAVATSAATGRCVVERWDYAAEAQAFGCADTTTVEPARA